MEIAPPVADVLVMAVEVMSLVVGVMVFLAFAWRIFAKLIE